MDMTGTPLVLAFQESFLLVYPVVLQSHVLFCELGTGCCTPLFQEQLGEPTSAVAYGSVTDSMSSLPFPWSSQCLDCDV